MPKKILSSEYKCECAELVVVNGYKHNDEAAAMDVRLSAIKKTLFIIFIFQKALDLKYSL